jgi:hypothetical protein
VTIRASDAERERVVAELREHAAAGRLTVDELADRIGAALAARTRDELADVQRDLPRRRAWPSHTRLSPDLRAYLIVNAFLVVVWFATTEPDGFGADARTGEFWPAWSILGWGLALVLGRLHSSGDRTRSRPLPPAR